MKKNLIVFGTRPEAIKMAPLIKQFRLNGGFETRVCLTGQHRQMVHQILDFFGIVPDYRLDIMEPDLYSLTSGILLAMKGVLDDYRPDFVYLHGDTTTSTAAGIASFYSGAKICHVEAGLRTHNKLSPFPEEMNRQITSRIADYHFAPTEKARQNLILENIPAGRIVVTGNTGIDALLQSADRIGELHDAEITGLKKTIDPECRLILVTAHRRENQREGLPGLCEALKTIAKNNPDVRIVYPVHLNPGVQKTVYHLLSGVENISLLPPLNYPAFVWMMARCHLIITDSGGVQEEAPVFGKPVLVIRNTTERWEAVVAGTAVLTGTDKKRIVAETEDLLNNPDRYDRMSRSHNPYGDGKACERIVEFVQGIK